MKTSKIWMMLLLIGMGFLPSLSYSQAWNPQQKEVWSNVEAYWALQSKGDAEGFLAYFSPDYQGWEYNSAIPQDKTTTAKYVNYGLKNSKSLFYDLTPLAIIVRGDVAIVDYLYNEQSEGMDGKKSWKSGRWTDILNKQGTKWVLIADHGGEVDKK